MSLFIQIRSLLYFFLMGVGYSFVLAYVLCILQGIKITWLKNSVESIVHIGFTIILYMGLLRVNQGIIHLYFIMSLAIGFFLGYVVYQPIVLPYAMKVRKLISRGFLRYQKYVQNRKQKKLEKKQNKEDKV